MMFDWLMKLSHEFCFFCGKEKAFLSRSPLDKQRGLFWGRFGSDGLGHGWGEDSCFRIKTLEGVNYTGLSALVMIVAFYKIGCIL